METTGKHMELIQQYFGEFSDKQLEQFRALGPLYQEWNEKINVISRKDMESLYEKHVLHSLSIAAVFEFPAGAKVIDLGTGGGFPGIPLAIFFPEVQFHLVDSIGKKIKVVEAVKEGLQLDNVTTQHTRAEDIKNRQFDIMVSRAVAPLKDLWNWGKPLLRKSKNVKPGELQANGLICLKGGDLTKEIAESTCRPELIEINSLFPLPFFDEKFIVHVPW